jgi:hypothetical protein
MSIAYFLQYFDSSGGLLRFEMMQCADDAEAMQKALAKPLPPGCMSIEVARGDGFIWRGQAAELAAAVH